MADVLYITDILYLPEARAGLTAMAARDACCRALRSVRSYP